MKTDCTRIPKAVDFVSGELDVRECADFSRHLLECAKCRAEVQELESLRARLVSLPRPEPRRSPQEIAAAAVMADAVPQRKEFPRKWMSAAAAIMLSAAGIWAMNRPGSPSPALAVNPAPANDVDRSVDRAIEWLESHQDADGSWNVEKWGARPEFQVALTALSTIAVRNSPDNPEGLEKAVAWLTRQQGPDGMFGPKGVGRPFNQSLATLALLRAPQDPADTRLKQAIRSGIDAILRSQVPDGGWGHYGSADSNSAVTAWHVQALEAAYAQGWNEVSDALQRGRQCLLRTPSSLEESVLEKPGGFDMCSAYFSAIQWSQQHDPTSRARLADLRKTLLHMQTASGNDSGSWPPDDTRNQVGGRLFSTSLAALALDTSR